MIFPCHEFRIVIILDPSNGLSVEHEWDMDYEWNIYRRLMEYSWNLESYISGLYNIEYKWNINNI